MVNRIVTWHIPQPGAPLPGFYMERDYTPEKVRIYAEQAPSGGDLEVDIRDDGVTIFANRVSTIEKKSVVYSEISYNTLVSTFTLDEIITGGTSAAKGRVVTNARGNMELTLIGTVAFSVGETITGASSAATAVILYFYRGGNPLTYSTGAAKTTAILPKNANLEEHAEDFPSSEATIEAGSVLTCHEIKSNGAANVTVQLELESLDDEDEETD